jgi:hypothetical protein
MQMVQHLRRQLHPAGSVRVFHEVGPKQPLLWVADALCGAVTQDRCGNPGHLARLIRSGTVRVIYARA